MSCRRAASGDSNWGCDGNNLGLVIQDGNDALTAPVYDVTVGMTPKYAWGAHAHWYTMDGVHGKSEQMAWIFREPYVFAAKEYKLWYNEDLTGWTEGDNRGEACYDVAFDVNDDGECGQLAPLQFRNVCTAARGEGHGRTLTLPTDTCITEIAVHHISGWVSCVGAGNHGARSHFGCSTNLVGLVWTKGNDRNVIMPTNQVEGFTRTGHNHAHWYTMAGVNAKTSRTLSMKLKAGVKPLKVSSLDLWYNEDLSGGTESDNSGRACYEVSVHRALSC
jgi:hypothetical protein